MKLNAFDLTNSLQEFDFTSIFTLLFKRWFATLLSNSAYKLRKGEYLSMARPHFEQLLLINEHSWQLNECLHGSIKNFASFLVHFEDFSIFTASSISFMHARQFFICVIHAWYDITWLHGFNRASRLLIEHETRVSFNEASLSDGLSNALARIDVWLRFGSIFLSWL